MTAMCFSGFGACRTDDCQIAMAPSCSGDRRHGFHAQGICHTAHEVRLGAARASVKVESVASATTSERKNNLMFTRGQLDTVPNLHLRRPMKMKKKNVLHPRSVRDATARVQQARCSGESNVHLKISILQSQRFAWSVDVYIDL